MKKIQDPKMLTREALAQQAFSWALSLIPSTKKHKETEARAILFGAVCIYYARPFTSNKGFGMISPDIVPEDMKITHTRIIKNRHRIIAHSDIGEEINRLYIRSDGNSALVENRHKAPDDDFLLEVEKLIKIVLEKTKVRINESLNSGVSSETKLAKGLYRFSVGEPPVWLEEIEDDGLGNS
ncbi:hypothetical protein P4E94_19600 [Pontiellaceae bacterium B12219]|nr:hypothetical protein [Pontiellaceae bacterium B12219]